MKKKVFFIALSIFLALILLISFKFFNNNLKLNENINHLEMAQRLAKNEVSDKELEEKFGENTNLDGKLVVFLASYINGLPEEDLFKAVDESKISKEEKDFLVKIIKKDFLPKINK